MGEANFYYFTCLNFVSYIKGKKTQDAISQNSEDQKGVGEEAEAESAHPAVDPNANGQHDPLQRQKASLEKNQAQALNPSNVPLRDIDGEVTKRGNMASVSSIGGSDQRASVDDSIRGGKMEEDRVRKETVSVFLVYGFCVRLLRIISFSSQVIFSTKHLCN